MPPITDPNTLAQIRAQQQQSGSTLAAPPPYYNPAPDPMGGQTPPPPNPLRVQQQNAETARIHLEQQAGARAEAKTPAEVEKAGTDAELAKLDLRNKRIAAGLDPDTGKPDATRGLLGPDAIADLTPGEQETVKAITTGRFPVSSFSTRNPETMKLIQRAMQYEPGTDLTTFQRRSVAFQKFMSNPNTPMLRVNQALQHLNSFYESAHALDNNHSGVLTSLLNYPRAASMAVEKDPRYTAFATDRDALSGELAAAFKGSNDTALADKEHWRSILSAANSPESFDSAIKEAVRLLEGRIEASQFQFRQAVGTNADKYDLMSPGARKAYDRFSADDFGTPQATDNSDKKLSTDVKTLEIPKGYQDEHAAFLAAHRGDLTVPDYIAFRKQMDEKYGRASPLDPTEVQHFVDGINKGTPSARIPGTEQKLNTLEKVHAGVAESAPGNFLMNMGDAGSFGLVDAAIGQEGRDKEALANAAHPVASTLGEITGSVMGMGAMDRGVLKLAEQLGVKPETVLALQKTGRLNLGKDIGVNAGYGAVRGFNGADDGDGLNGAFKGAAGGAVAAGAGQLVTKGVLPALSERTLQALETTKGIDRTTLQRLGLGKAEEALQGVPFSHGARAGSIASFNLDNANRVLANIGSKVPKGVEAGTELNAEVDKQLNNAYNTIKPRVVGSVDKTFEDQLTALRALADTPEKKTMFTEITSAFKNFADKTTGHYDGEGYQSASQRLRALTDLWSTQAENQGSVAAQDMARMAGKARKMMQTLVQRQTPDVGADLKNVERGWAHKMRIEDASNRALANNEATYSPGQYLTSIKKFDTSANKGMTARGKSLDQPYAEATQKVLGSQSVPQKLSIRETAYVGAALGASSYASPAIPAFIAAVSAGAYGPGIKRVTQALLAGKRPAVIDNEVVRHAFQDFTRNKMTGN